MTDDDTIMLQALLAVVGNAAPSEVEAARDLAPIAIQDPTTLKEMRPSGVQFGAELMAAWPDILALLQSIGVEFGAGTLTYILIENRLEKFMKRRDMENRPKPPTLADLNRLLEKDGIQFPDVETKARVLDSLMQSFDSGSR